MELRSRSGTNYNYFGRGGFIVIHLEDAKIPKGSTSSYKTLY